jgi:hypothetical protein
MWRKGQIDSDRFVPCSGAKPAANGAKEISAETDLGMTSAGIIRERARSGIDNGLGDSRVRELSDRRAQFLLNGACNTQTALVVIVENEAQERRFSGGIDRDGSMLGLRHFEPCATRGRE